MRSTSRLMMCLRHMANLPPPRWAAGQIQPADGGSRRGGQDSDRMLIGGRAPDAGITAKPVLSDSHLDLCLVWDFELPTGLRFCLGLPFNAGGVLCSRFPVSMVGGHTS